MALRRNLSFDAAMRHLHHIHYKQNARRERQKKRALKHKNPTEAQI